MLNKQSGYQAFNVLPLAKIHKPEIDIRKPYTEISGKGTFSGRAYDEKYLKQKVLSLKSHTSADKQTKAFGDVEITLSDDHNVVTCYEVKTKEIIESDIHIALEKIKKSSYMDNYIFITTEPVQETIREIAKKSYPSTGVEIAILDCIGFIKHFLCLFYRIRMNFLNEYQKLVLSEPASAVSQELKEAFIVLRKACEQENI